jgi:hypothetical protein
VKRRLRAPKGVQAIAREPKVLFEFGDPIFRVCAVSLQPPDLDRGKRQIGHKELIPIPRNIFQQLIFPVPGAARLLLAGPPRSVARGGPPLRVIKDLSHRQATIHGGPGRQARQGSSKRNPGKRRPAMMWLRERAAKWVTTALAQNPTSARTSPMRWRGISGPTASSKKVSNPLLSAVLPGH